MSLLCTIHEWAVSLQQMLHWPLLEEGRNNWIHRGASKAAAQHTHSFSIPWAHLLPHELGLHAQRHSPRQEFTCPPFNKCSKEEKAHPEYEVSKGGSLAFPWASGILGCELSYRVQSGWGPSFHQSSVSCELPQERAWGPQAWQFLLAKGDSLEAGAAMSH